MKIAKKIQSYIHNKMGVLLPPKIINYFIIIVVLLIILAVSLLYRASSVSPVDYDEEADIELMRLSQ